MLRSVTLISARRVASRLLLSFIAGCTAATEPQTADTSARSESPVDDGADTDLGADSPGDTDSDSDTQASPCTSHMAVVTDIDGTLTQSDSEWTNQILNPGAAEPQMRPMASDAFQAFHDLGYTVVYLTARGVDVRIGDGRTATEATTDWLLDQGFPTVDGNLHLAPGGGAHGDAAEHYKAAILADLQADGLELAYGYGDKATDILAFKSAGIPDPHIFHVGETQTEHGVDVLPDGQAYGQHLLDYLPGVPSACDR